MNQFEGVPRYWTDGRSRNELDFMIQRENDIFPIEVKSDENVESKCLKVYSEKYAANTKLHIRFSMENLKKDGNLLNIPLFLADYLDKVIALSV